MLKNAWQEAKGFLTWKHVPEMVAAIVGAFGVVLAIIAGVASAVETRETGSSIAASLTLGSLVFMLMVALWTVFTVAVHSAADEVRIHFSKNNKR